MQDDTMSDEWVGEWVMSEWWVNERSVTTSTFVIKSYFNTVPLSFASTWYTYKAWSPKTKPSMELNPVVVSDVAVVELCWNWYKFSTSGLVWAMTNTLFALSVTKSLFTES